MEGFGEGGANKRMGMREGELNLGTWGFGRGEMGAVDVIESITYGIR